MDQSRKDYLIAAILFISLAVLLMFTQGCVTANQLAGEKAYYEAMTAMQKQQGAVPLVQIIPQDKDKPITMSNIASFTVFAPPQGSSGPTLSQYQHVNMATPWLNVIGAALPWLGTWGIVKAVADIPRVNSTVNTNSGNVSTSATNTSTSTATTSTFSSTASGGSVANMGSGQANLNNISTVEAPVVVPPVSYPPK